MIAAAFMLLGLMLGLLIPRDIAPMRSFSAWLMRNTDNRTLATVIIGIAFGILAALILTGCGTGVRPQRGGESKVTLAGIPPTVATITQPENPGAASSQQVHRDETRQNVVSIPTVRVTETPQTDGTVVRVTEQFAPQVLTSTVKEHTATTLGAAQKDEAREIGAKLASFRFVQYAGIAVLLLGAFGYAHPVGRALIGGKDTALIVGLVGVGMVAGPFILVQYANYLWLLLLVAAAYWFLSRMKYQHGQLDALKEKAP